MVCGAALLLFAVSLQGAASDALLADAAEKMDRAKISALLNQRVDVNAPQIDGMTALHWATYQDDLEIGKLLVRCRCEREGCEPVWRDAAACSPARMAMAAMRRAALDCRGGPEHCPAWRRNPVDDGCAQRLAPLGEGALVPRREG